MTTNNAPLPSGEVSTEEKALRQESAAAAAIANIRQRAREESEAEFVKLLKELDAPIRTNVPELVNRRGEQIHRITSPTEPLYRRMSAEEREWRNPDSDHWMAEWLRGRKNNDHARMMIANEKLEGMFGTSRAWAEGVAGAAGAESTGTAGGFVPRPLEAVVLIARDRVAKMRRFATLIQMTRQNHQIPTAGSMTASMVGESTSAAEGTPTTGTVDLIAKTANAKAYTSAELLDDSAINLLNILAVRGGGALGVLEDNQAFNDEIGTGSGNNITAINGTAFTETTSGIFAYSLDALRMYYAVPQQYRDGAVWFAASNVLQYLSGVRDTTGRPLYQGLIDVPGPISDDMSAVGSIFRKPVYEVPMTAGDLWFGNPSAQYAFGTRAGVQISVSEHARFEERELVWMITQRIAGANLDNSASQFCTGITSATSL